jgi:fructose-1,6-bisphosphatase/inositol monophosphatase family enzyme
MPDVAGLSDAPALLAATRRLHEDIRARVGALLERARATGRPELASAPGAWAAGDLTYALDAEAEAALDRFGNEIAARHPLTLVSEGPGVTIYGESAPGPALRAIVDPVDGTRSLMLDVRSAWALTGIAPDRGAATRLSDCVVAVQTELPTTSAGVYHVLTAVAGRGASIARHDVRTGIELERRPLLADAATRIDNGYLCFARYLPVERPLVADLERRFLERVIPAFDLSPRLIYDDQYLCSAGQLYLVATGRYRMLADLRGWLRRTRGIENFCSKPYDLASLLIWREAGVPVLDETLLPLDAPLDTETPLSVVAFANDSLRERLASHLRAVMEEPA